MPGTRQGPGNRPAWEHPRDLVKLLEELRGAFPGPTEASEQALEREGFERLVDIAWMHDLIEDGMRRDGVRVTAEDLRREGFDEIVVAGVILLTHREGVESKIAYLERLATTLGEGTAVVKLADRICNLREGKICFKDKRWARVVRETDQYIVPLLNKVQEPERGWLKEKLSEARDARPVVEGV